MSTNDEYDDKKLPLDCQNDVYMAWEYIKLLTEQLEKDVYEFSDGNLSAGVRFRKGLKLLDAWAPQVHKIALNYRQIAKKKRKKEYKKRKGQFGSERDPRTFEKLG